MRLVRRHRYQRAVGAPPLLELVCAPEELPSLDSLPSTPCFSWLLSYTLPLEASACLTETRWRSRAVLEVERYGTWHFLFLELIWNTYLNFALQASPQQIPEVGVSHTGKHCPRKWASGSLGRWASKYLTEKWDNLGSGMWTKVTIISVSIDQSLFKVSFWKEIDMRVSKCSPG